MWKPVEVATKNVLTNKHLRIRTPSIPQSPEIPFSKIKDIYCMNSLKTRDSCVENKDQSDFEKIYMKRVG